MSVNTIGRPLRHVITYSDKRLNSKQETKRGINVAGLKHARMEGGSLFICMSKLGF